MNTHQQGGSVLLVAAVNSLQQVGTLVGDILLVTAVNTHLLAGSILLVAPVNSHQQGGTLVEDILLVEVVNSHLLAVVGDTPQELPI